MQQNVTLQWQLDCFLHVGSTRCVLDALHCTACLHLYFSVFWHVFLLRMLCSLALPTDSQKVRKRCWSDSEVLPIPEGFVSHPILFQGPEPHCTCHGLFYGSICVHFLFTTTATTALLEQVYFFFVSLCPELIMFGVSWYCREVSWCTFSTHFILGLDSWFQLCNLILLYLIWVWCCVICPGRFVVLQAFETGTSKCVFVLVADFLWSGMVRVVPVMAHTSPPSMAV